jgi:hypothetical protein
MKTEKTLVVTLVGLLMVGIFVTTLVLKNGGEPLINKIPKIKSVIIVVDK